MSHAEMLARRISAALAAHELVYESGYRQEPDGHWYVWNHGVEVGAMDDRTEKGKLQIYLTVDGYHFAKPVTVKIAPDRYWFDLQNSATIVFGKEG